MLTNDASRTEETSAEKYRGFGLNLSPSDLVTSGSLLTTYFRENGLEGAPTAVLGTEDSKTYATRAGGTVVGPDDVSLAVVVVADDGGFDVLETLNRLVTTLIRRLTRGSAPISWCQTLICCSPTALAHSASPQVPSPISLKR